MTSQNTPILPIPVYWKAVPLHQIHLQQFHNQVCPYSIDQNKEKKIKDVVKIQFRHTKEERMEVAEFIISIFIELTEARKAV